MDDTFDFDRVVSAKEAAELLELKLGTVRVMISRHELETCETRLGRFITLDSVEEYKRTRRGVIGRPKRQKS